MNKPFTMNIINPDGSVVTDTFETQAAACCAAREEAMWESCAHVEVVHEPTGQVVLELDGTFAEE